MLMIQIAFGIVLGVLILRFLPTILAFGVFAVVAVVVIALGIGAWVAISAHPDTALHIASAGAALVVIALVVQYSARGMGHVYFSLRPRIAESVFWRNLLVLNGVEVPWITTEQEKSYLARAVGDRLFIGIFKAMFWYVAVTFLLFACTVVAAADQLPAYGKPHHYVVWLLLGLCATLPGVVLFCWMRSRDPVYFPRA